jgi:tetratricopeptide (TPR) repeat protein
MQIAARALGRRFTKGLVALRRNYAVAGIVVAILVAALIVVAGSRSRSDDKSGAGHDRNTAAVPSTRPSPTTESPSPTDYAAVIRLLKARYAEHPSSTTTAMALADAYLMTEQPTKAQRLYASVLAADPGNQDAESQLALALHASGHDDQALDLLTGVLKVNPRSQLAHFNLAVLYFSQQKSRQAREEWNRAAAIDPASNIGHTARSFVNLMQGSMGGAQPSTSNGG